MRYDAIIALDELKNENNQAGQEQNMWESWATNSVANSAASMATSKQLSQSNDLSTTSDIVL
jgi:hypothetical protein